MASPRYPITTAIRFLRTKKVPYSAHRYTYVDHGGTRQAAKQLNIGEHQIIKTLVMETENHHPLLVLMHGDQAVSTRQLARVIGSKKVRPVRPERALSCTGYPVGGISPFGTRQALPVYVQATILNLDTIYINGGKRGFLVKIDPNVLLDQLSATPVDVATKMH